MLVLSGWRKQLAEHGAAAFLCLEGGLRLDALGVELGEELAELGEVLLELGTLGGERVGGLSPGQARGRLWSPIQSLPWTRSRERRLRAGRAMRHCGHRVSLLVRG